MAHVSKWRNGVTGLTRDSAEAVKLSQAGSRELADLNEWVASGQEWDFLSPGRLGKSQPESLKVPPPSLWCWWRDLRREAIKTRKPDQSCPEAVGLVLRIHETFASVGWVNP